MYDNSVKFCTISILNKPLLRCLRWAAAEIFQLSVSVAP